MMTETTAIHKEVPVATKRKTKKSAPGSNLKKIIDSARRQQQQQEQEPRQISRSSSLYIYTPQIADQIIARLASGETILRIARDEGMPDPASVHFWITTKPDFAKRYHEARSCAATSIVEQMMEDIETEDRPEQVGLLRLKAETKRWIAARFNPQMFGDTRKIDISGEIKHTHTLSLTEDQKKRIATEWIMAETNKNEPILITGTAETSGPDKKLIKKAQKNK